MTRTKKFLAMLGAILSLGLFTNYITNYSFTPTASAAGDVGNCAWGTQSCEQHITVNTVSQHTITVNYGTGGNFYIPKATSGNYLCGNAAGIYKIYVHSGYDIRIGGFFGVNEKERTYVKLYYRSTGWHTLPSQFRSPKCDNAQPTYGYKYGYIYDALEFKQ